MKINQYFILIFLFQWVYIQGQGMNNDISVDEIIDKKLPLMMSMIEGPR